MLTHKRERDPTPGNGPQYWRCRCGWSGSAENYEAMEKRFVEHIPEAEKRQCLLVDVSGDNPVVLLMPIAEPVGLVSHYESDGLRFGTILTGETYPIHEVRTETGQVFKAE